MTKPDSSMKRFRDALVGTPADRVPVFPLIGGWAAYHYSDVSPARTALDPERIVKAQVKAREAAGYDAVFPYVHPLYIPEAFGATVRFLETGPLVDPLPMEIRTLEDVDRIRRPDIRETPGLAVILKASRTLGEYGRRDVPVVGLFEGPFTTACRIVETESVMRMAYRNRPALAHLLDRITDFLLEFGAALVDHGAGALCIPEPTASSAMISPALFEQLVYPRLRTLFGRFQVPGILHICGDAAGLLKMMAATGAAVLSVDQCMDLAVCRALSPDAVLGGNVDPVNSLLLGTPDAVAEDTLACLRTAGPGRFVLMSGCGVPPHAPLENVQQMVETAVKYGCGDKEEGG